MKTAKLTGLALLCLLALPRCTCIQPGDQETSDDAAEDSSDSSDDPAT